MSEFLGNVFGRSSLKFHIGEHLGETVFYTRVLYINQLTCDRKETSHRQQRYYNIMPIEHLLFLIGLYSIDYLDKIIIYNGIYRTVTSYQLLPVLPTGYTSYH